MILVQRNFLARVSLIFISALSFSQTGEINLTNSEGNDRHPFWASDGNHIVFESDRDGDWEIYIMKADGTDQQRLTFSDSADRFPSFHPGADKIIFESNRTGKNALYTIKFKEKEPVPTLLEIPGFVLEPSTARFSPDGNKIIFSAITSSQAFNFDLFLFDIQSNELTQLTDDPYRSHYASWSPDGEKFVFFSRRETNGEDDEIYILQIETDEVKRLTHWPKHNFCPAWSPRGDKIAYVTSMENCRPELYMMHVDGTGQKRLTFNEDGETQPSWSPDGDQLIFTGYRDGNFEILMLPVGD